MSHNKFMCRYNRHKTKHGKYFEALAADVIRDGPITVQFGEQRFTVEVGKKFFQRRWLSISGPDGREVMGADISGFEELVPVIADYLMQLAADIPAVVTPPSDRAVRTED
ncbi:MAG TPA: hypothetical protein VGQ50_14330 [Actinomycetota bacterium]|jgi:hypothetical protein|nr:hypothetical protein [Actinomycetota bacterium]